MNKEDNEMERRITAMLNDVLKVDSEDEKSIRRHRKSKTNKHNSKPVFSINHAPRENRIVLIDLDPRFLQVQYKAHSQNNLYNAFALNKINFNYPEINRIDSSR